MVTRAFLVLIVMTACSGGDETGVQPATEVIREVTTGMRSNARVQVSMRASAEVPTPEDIEMRKRLEDAIEAENIGRLVSSSGGAGYVDIVVEVENTADAIPRIQEILRSMDAARHATFKVIPGADQ